MELKACPFCGCETVDILLDEKDLCFATPTTIVRCHRCSANTRSFYRDVAIEAWNRRKDGKNAE